MAENNLGQRMRGMKGIPISIEVMISVAAATRRSSNRVKNCDAVVRNTLLVDRMCTFVDALFTLLQCFIGTANEGLEEKDQIPQERIESWLTQIAQIDKEWSNDMTSLIEYIQQPMFSLDHPKGAELLRESKENFDGKIDGLEE
uniref:Uncharacterized protein n=1 Tax=Pithovirus LCPAC406 TaxID=2506599 RepID=A0A481ZDC8_9VIRU|nr:MAG: uncharacterized protein LCPAC406_02220 [Pithovirus LCPAC406]